MSTNEGGIIMDKDKVQFEEYGITFHDSEIENMSVQEIQECKDIISDIKKLLEG